MKEFKVKIFDHTTTTESRWEKSFNKINNYLKDAGVHIQFTVTKAKRTSPVFNEKAEGVRHHISKPWFKSTYSKWSIGYDFCVAYFDLKDWLKPYPKNDLRGQSIEQNYGVSEIAMTGSHTLNDSRYIAPRVKDTVFVTRFIHEMCHGVFDHKIKKPDVTHEYHYDKKDLLSALKLWGFKDGEKPKLTNRELLYYVAVYLIGVDASPNDVAPDELGCAETVNAIYKYVFKQEIGGTVSTNQLYKALLNHPHFVKVDQPLPGDIIISPSGYGNGKLTNGHVGIVGENGIVMSNDSLKGTWEKNFTIDKWKKYYVDIGGYPMDYFRRI